MTDWINTTFGALGELFDGPHATPTRRAEGPYFLNIASLKSGRLDLDASDHVSPEDFVKWTRRVTPRAGDLLFSYETRLGEAALMPAGVQACLGRRMALLRPNDDVVDCRFLLYFYLSPTFQRTISTHTIHGATVPRIGLASMPQWTVRIPPLDEQRSIAEVLGALDDKVLCNRRIASSAAALAESMFLEGVAGVTDVATLGDIATIVLGGTPSRSRRDFWEGGTVPWLASGKANEERVLTPSELITKEALENSAAKLMPRGSTILAITGATLGQIARLEIEACGNQSLIGVWNDDAAMNDWLYFAIRREIDQLLKHATGAAQQHVNKGAVEALRIPILSPAETRRWADSIRPLLDMSATADRESAVLVKARDELLPLLMSGKVRVRKAEKVVEGVL
ncbi:type I restriction enzyme S subunit [Kribbella voronezhensis]|uniref:Type I restriction enzyme S subunit n=1 Tax=Kribbella voronezhensis TaxID=2512212 RepID=A0A4R7TBV2_9ACTN|nr:restriction endonuclease subunit S [Kribbella voronezhensis]TDU88818.1 type I restriction enzyme S subunit [Kribbella voronezhensis]